MGCIVADPQTYVTHPMVREATLGQDAPLTDEVAERLLCPSLHPLMSTTENQMIAEAIDSAVRKVS
ncbi:hypothetical protein [Actinomadura sp. CNU-125]|uniref:hypothetical protein n=1 Tax=Actinomadura sp. CNU-125 TaxID=1904961 RepID=UPI0021CCD540|nr:hypothetical protein [Actinomadura sp. CNU-125]